MADQETVAALAALATPVAPATSGTDTELSSSIPRSFGDARIVGLGEATHGTRECFEQKRRLIQYLVAERGFRTVAFEADAAAATALDAYVRDGNGFSEPPADPASALADLDMWQWRTESVRELLAWLRTFNDGRDREETVRVRGVDLSTPSAPAAPLRAYFETVAPDAVESEPFRSVADATVPDDDAERERVLDDVAAAAATLAERLGENRDAYEASSSREALRAARHCCRVIEQTCEWARVRHEQPGPHPDGMAVRDRFMAENALWALGRDPGNGVALWAHDGHVKRGTFDDGTPWADVTTMGDRLARQLDESYTPVGFDFARRSFRAVGADSGEVGTFTVTDPPDGSATAAFAGVDGAPFLLDLDAAADDGRLGSWLAAERRKRHVGSVYDPDGGSDGGYGLTELSASFDRLLFLPASSPTRPLDGA